MTVKLSLVPKEGQCSAYARTAGRTCQRPAIPGGTVCDIHGGSVPATRAAAARRWVEVQGLAFEVLLLRLQDQLAISDPMFAADIKTILEVADKSTRNVQLLSGEATERKETRTSDIKLQLNAKLDQLGDRLGGKIIDAEEVEED